MKILKYQGYHVLLLFILLFGVYEILKLDGSFFNGSLWGIPTIRWFDFAILSAIIHQVYVVLTWRIELFHKGLTKMFGAKAFKLFKVGFALLILSRPVLITMLAISNAGSLMINSNIGYTMSILLAIPSAYLFYSVKKYFGMDRAFGIDHFQPDIYKGETYIKQGIFKYTSNGMYVFGFFLLWIPGFLFLSKAALLAALFHHLYIWVHYYTTELPDMNEIYKG